MYDLQEETWLDTFVSFLSLDSDVMGIVGFLCTLTVVAFVCLVLCAICATIAEERRHRWIGKIVEQEFNCRPEEYTILEPTNPDWKGVYDIIAFASGTYYAIRFSHSRKILMKKQLDSWKDV